MVFPFDGSSGPMGVNALGAYWYDKWLYPIEWVVAWIMYGIHQALNFIGLDGSLDGLAWVLSIVGLTIVVRIAIIPLFFKQIKASRGMQLIQPEMKKIQEKYKGRTDTDSRMAMSAELQALYKKHGANPMSSCWPVLLQMPVFFSLFSVLRSMRTLSHGLDWAGYQKLGPITESVAKSFEGSTFFSVRLSDTLMPWDTSTTATKIMCVVLIIAMVVTQFLTMRQLTMKNMPKNATSDDNPMMRTQKTMMYMMPLFMGFTGIFFQVGVLFYWLTTNLWTTGQQAWTIARMPAPGSEAYDKLQAKHKAAYETYRREISPEYEEKIAAAKEADNQEEVTRLEGELASKLQARKVKLGLEDPKAKKDVSAPAAPVERIQPKRTTRAQRKKQGQQARANNQNLTPQEQAARRAERRAKARGKGKGKK